jgi:DNA topoisomerase-1
MNAPTRIPDGERTPAELAALAGLRHVRDAEAGITRRVVDEGFSYFYPDGRPVRGRDHLSRIEELAIPPAWDEIWICRRADGHLQATGRDAKGRKQYVYHERWMEISNRVKFGRLHAFGRALPVIRAAVRDALRKEDATLRKMSAVLVALLDRTYARIGNEEYVRANGSFGLSTLRRKHAAVEGRRVLLTFPAKGGAERVLTVKHPPLVRIIEAGIERPGHRLFRYRENGRWRDLEADQVNEFLGDIVSEDFTAKDFRTWKASALMAGDLYEHREACSDPDPDTRAQVIRDAVSRVAEALGNTAAVCRTYYIHPVLIESFEDGSFQAAVEGFAPARRAWLDDHEQVLLRVLRHFERS